MPVRKALLKQIVPAVISQMIVLIYSLADTYFVGLLNDPRQTAAVTVVSSAFLMLTAVSNLFAVGGASLAARTLGRREDEKAKDICALSFWGALLASVLFSLLFWSLASPILYLCGATADTYPFAFGYAKWVVLFGGAGTVLNVLLANLIRAEGNALVAALGVSLGGICNIVLDPIFVLPRFLNLGAAGAGAATAISNTAAALFFILFAAAKRRSTIVSLSPARLKRAHKHIKDILAVGFPSAVQYALTVVSIAAISKFVSGYATEASPRWASSKSWTSSRCTSPSAWQTGCCRFWLIITRRETKSAGMTRFCSVAASPSAFRCCASASTSASRPI